VGFKQVMYAVAQAVQVGLYRLLGGIAGVDPRSSSFSNWPLPHLTYFAGFLRHGNPLVTPTQKKKLYSTGLGSGKMTK